MNTCCIQNSRVATWVRQIPERRAARQAERAAKWAAEQLNYLVLTWTHYDKDKVPNESVQPLAEALAKYTSDGHKLHYSFKPAGKNNENILVTAFGDTIVPSIIENHSPGEELFNLMINPKDDVKTNMDKIMTLTETKVKEFEEKGIETRTFLQYDMTNCPWYDFTDHYSLY